jgi:hypothetical protein
VEVQFAQIIDVLPSMNGRQRLIDHVFKQREMEAIQMEMQDIESFRALSNLGEHR